MRNSGRVAKSLTVLALASLAFGAAAGASVPTWNSLPALKSVQASLKDSWATKDLPSPTDPTLGSRQGGLLNAEFRGQTNCGAVGGATADITSETPCFFGDLTAKRSVVVVGDSQANMWLPTLDSWGVHEHWKVYRIVKFGCEPWKDHTDPGWAKCFKFKSFEVRAILRLHPQAIIGAGMEADNQSGPLTISVSKLKKAIEGFARQFSSIHATVVVLQNTPWFFAQGSPQLCLSAYSTDVQKCNHVARSAVVNSTMHDAMQAAAAAHFVRVIPADQLFCSGAVCPVLVGNYNVWSDGWHFQNAWGRHIAKAFSQLMPRL